MDPPLQTASPSDSPRESSRRPYRRAPRLPPVPSLYSYWPMVRPRRIMESFTSTGFTPHHFPGGGAELAELLEQGGLRMALRTALRAYYVRSIVDPSNDRSYLARKRLRTEGRSEHDDATEFESIWRPSTVHLPPLAGTSSASLDQTLLDDFNNYSEDDISEMTPAAVEEPSELPEDLLPAILCHTSLFAGRNGFLAPREPIPGAPESDMRPAFDRHLEKLLDMGREYDEAVPGDDAEALPEGPKAQRGYKLAEARAKSLRGGLSYRELPIWRDAERIMDHSALMAMGLLARILAEDAWEDGEEEHVLE